LEWESDTPDREDEVDELDWTDRDTALGAFAGTFRLKEFILNWRMDSVALSMSKDGLFLSDFYQFNHLLNAPVANKGGGQALS
jgi:hypothetical protein